MHEDALTSAADPIRSNCPYCGAEVVGRNRMCLVHLVADPDWAAANRAMCDFVHRGRTIDSPPTAIGSWDVRAGDGDDAEALGPSPVTFRSVAADLDR